MQRFQSSPPEFGGRVAYRKYQQTRGGGFNPRPPNSGGASRRRCSQRSYCYVSILAPRIRGARPGHAVLHFGIYLFQSSPPEFGGRVQIVGRTLGQPRCFNPRPPNSGGASRSSRHRDAAAESFNPRPPNSGGASVVGVKAGTMAPCFNPRPPNSGGASTAFRTSGPPCKRFNPRPPNSGGASSQNRPVFLPGYVSILAPRIRGARQAEALRKLASIEFQSSPPEFGGRVRHRHGQQVAHHRVSILAPRIRGARPPHLGIRVVEQPVSILAPRIRGARPGSGSPTGRVRRFQSSPPEFGGRVMKRFSLPTRW